MSIVSFYAVDLMCIKVEKMAYCIHMHYTISSDSWETQASFVVCKIKHDKYTMSLSLSYLKSPSQLMRVLTSTSCTWWSVCMITFCKASWSRHGGTGALVAVQLCRRYTELQTTSLLLFSLDWTRAANITLCAGAEISNYWINKHRQVSIKMTDTCQS